MKKLLPFILFALTACGTVTNTMRHSFGDTMMVTSDVIYTKASLDSMCMSDNLPTDLSLWDSIPTRDYETNSVIVLHYLYNGTDSTETLYKVERLGNDSFKVNKREIK